MACESMTRRVVASSDRPAWTVDSMALLAPGPLGTTTFDLRSKYWWVAEDRPDSEARVRSDIE